MAGKTLKAADVFVYTKVADGSLQWASMTSNTYLPTGIGSSTQNGMRIHNGTEFKQVIKGSPNDSNVGPKISFCDGGGNWWFVPLSIQTTGTTSSGDSITTDEKYETPRLENVTLKSASYNFANETLSFSVTVANPTNKEITCKLLASINFIYSYSGESTNRSGGTTQVERPATINAKTTGTISATNLSMRHWGNFSQNSGIQIRECTLILAFLGPTINVGINQNISYTQ